MASPVDDGKLLCSYTLWDVNLVACVHTCHLQEHFCPETLRSTIVWTFLLWHQENLNKKGNGVPSQLPAAISKLCGWLSLWSQSQDISYVGNIRMIVIDTYVYPWLFPIIGMIIMKYMICIFIMYSNYTSFIFSLFAPCFFCNTGKMWSLRLSGNSWTIFSGQQRWRCVSSLLGFVRCSICHQLISAGLKWFHVYVMMFDASFFFADFNRNFVSF